MTDKDKIRNDYFEWLSDIVCDDGTYRKLLMALHGTDFRWSIPYDANRAEDGKYLRYLFGAENILDSPCSVLEMLVALSKRCEEDIMIDDDEGDRTSLWFWTMIENLSLDEMTNSNFNKRYVTKVLNDFLDRKYEPNGKGGLFVLEDCPYDLRHVEIWYQLCWYLDEYLEKENKDG